MTRKKLIPQLPAIVRAQRPQLAPEANRSFHRIDELDAQSSWQHHIDTGLIPCPGPVEGKVR